MVRSPKAWLALVAALACVGLPILAGSQAKNADFTRVQTIFKARCYSCHSGAEAAAGMDLSSTISIAKAGVVKAGNPKTSELMLRLEGQGDLPQMPMGFAPLDPDDMAAIRDWIKSGAQFNATTKHWAYIAPRRPVLPRVKTKSWVRNPIDAMILARLEKGGLRPSPVASKETLIRRASLDLVGLPPTPAEIDAFLQDKSPNAYEKVVDRLLASPQYGERQARIWLDLARYADSDGYEKDLSRTAWPYRDWVIQAFNKNMPYDRFTVEQLAGDLLPNPTTSQLVATGFQRNTMFNQEGGVDQAEARFEVIGDRVSTTGTVWLGSSIGCAKCHDHKYDPFKQKDYYKIYAFYSNTDYTPTGPASIGEEKWVEPKLPVPSADQARQQQALKTRIVELEKQLATLTPDLLTARTAWEKNTLLSANWDALNLSSAISKNGSTLTTLKDGTVAVSGKNPDRDMYTLATTAPVGGVTGLRLDILPDDAYPNKGPGRADNGNFVLSTITITVNGKPVNIRTGVADHEQKGFPARDALDDKADSGWAGLPELGKPHMAVFETDTITAEGPAKVEIVLKFESVYPQHSLARFRISLTRDADPAARLVPADIVAILRSSERTAAQVKILDAYFLATTPALADHRKALQTAKNDLSKLDRLIPTAQVMREKPRKGPLTTNLHPRGEFVTLGEVVQAGVPTFLNPWPKNAPKDRLGLALWIADKRNPLTARVQVNRMWEQYFGRGIVETLEDFGRQGSEPSHPELLDWLATEFMDRGWDMKAIHRLIVTSATYRQASTASAALLKRDPNNVLLARGPRFRLEAEMIRDNALRAAGLLSLKVGGPSVYPHQPDDIWGSPYSGETWNTSRGPDLFRRGIYTFIKRTSPYPTFLALDATSRESCIVRRIRTNTPLQALAMLNDPAFLTAARGLARRMLFEAGPNTASKARYGFRLCTSRFPSEDELVRIARLYDKTLVQYRKDPEQAKKLGGTPEFAAWVVVGNVLLNLDETLTKG